MSFLSFSLPLLLGGDSCAPLHSQPGYDVPPAIVIRRQRYRKKDPEKYNVYQREKQREYYVRKCDSEREEKKNTNDSDISAEADYSSDTRKTSLDCAVYWLAIYAAIIFCVTLSTVEQK